MKETPDSSVEQKFDALARELRVMRYLVIFLCACLGILLFLPRLAMAIAEKSNAAWDFLEVYIGGIVSVLLAIVIVFLSAAYIVGRIAVPADAVQKEKAGLPLSA